jgi:hypothetical protein
MVTKVQVTEEDREKVGISLKELANALKNLKVLNVINYANQF